MIIATRWGWLIQVLSLLAAVSSAPGFGAEIDIATEHFRNSSLGPRLIDPLLPTDAAEAETVSGNMIAACTRIRVEWSGRSSAPLIRYADLSAAMIAHLVQANREEGIVLPCGIAYPSARQPGYAVVDLGPDGLLAGPPRLLAAYRPQPWPATTGAWVVFRAAGADIKLGELRDRISQLELQWTKDSAVLRATAPGPKDAAYLHEYVVWRAPLVTAAAAAGFEKAVLPSKLLAATLFTVDGVVLVGTATINDELLQFTIEHLTGLVARQMRKYR